jgi:hypothetical protein
VLSFSCVLQARRKAEPKHSVLVVLLQIPFLNQGGIAIISVNTVAKPVKTIILSTNPKSWGDKKGSESHYHLVSQLPAHLVETCLHDACPDLLSKCCTVFVPKITRVVF